MTKNERLRRFREVLKLKQSDIEETLGLGGGAYSPIETGKSALTMGNLEKLCNTYYLNPTWYLLGVGAMRLDKEELIEKNNYQNVVSNNIGGVNNISQEIKPSDCEKELTHLREMLAEKERLIEEKERMIQVLMSK